MQADVKMFQVGAARINKDCVPFYLERAKADGLSVIEEVEDERGADILLTYWKAGK